jgi:hypothetical protein
LGDIIELEGEVEDPRREHEVESAIGCGRRGGHEAIGVGDEDCNGDWRHQRLFGIELAADSGVVRKRVGGTGRFDFKVEAEVTDRVGALP